QLGGAGWPAVRARRPSRGLGRFARVRADRRLAGPRPRDPALLADRRLRFPRPAGLSGAGAELIVRRPDQRSVSSQIVNGPSLTSSTAISAPNRPVWTSATPFAS